jgi:hypothetical protein
MNVILSDESAQLKVLQTVVALLGTRAFSIHGDDLSQVLGVCMRMLLHAHHTKGLASSNLSQPLSASLKQIIGTLLDRTHSLLRTHAQLSHTG